MSETREQTWEHVLELRPGASGTINFRFPIDIRTRLDVRLVSADQATGITELVVNDPGQGYDMLQVVEGAYSRWKRVPPGADGEVHFLLNLKAGERLHIEADDKFAHSIRLTKAEWHRDSLRLSFQESS
jgi:hypothetical protein